MAQVTLKGNAVQTCGELPKVGDKAPGFRLVANDLSEKTLDDYTGKKKVLNIFPSIDTGTCALSVKQFNERSANHPNTAVLNISADLPFAQKRFCGAEGINNVETLSSFRSAFAREWGLEFSDGPLKGLCSRCVVVLDENDSVLYTEQVSEITSEPNYDAALKAL